MLGRLINRIMGKGNAGNDDHFLSFKDNQSAFDYACQFMDSKIQMDKPMLAIVEPGPTGEQPIQMDSGRQRTILRVCSDDGGFMVVADSAYDKGPRLRIGDLVAWLPVDYAAELKGQVDDPRFAIMGFIVGTLHPVLSGEGWKAKDKFHN
ncbi:hypothetical protein ACG1VR_10540 [Cedecea davisae]|uniref:hypothetical protein n=1 Tax=Cedecea davisae TaxID=158484 RepID=UPI00376F3C7A